MVLTSTSSSSNDKIYLFSKCWSKRILPSNYIIDSENINYRLENLFGSESYRVKDERIGIASIRNLKILCSNILFLLFATFERSNFSQVGLKQYSVPIHKNFIVNTLVKTDVNIKTNLRSTLQLENPANKTPRTQKSIHFNEVDEKCEGKSCAKYKFYKSVRDKFPKPNDIRKKLSQSKLPKVTNSKNKLKYNLQSRSKDLGINVINDERALSDKVKHRGELKEPYKVEHNSSYRMRSSVLEKSNRTMLINEVISKDAPKTFKGNKAEQKRFNNTNTLNDKRNREIRTIYKNVEKSNSNSLISVIPSREWTSSSRYISSRPNSLLYNNHSRGKLNNRTDIQRSEKNRIRVIDSNKIIVDECEMCNMLDGESKLKHLKSNKINKRTEITKTEKNKIKKPDSIKPHLSNKRIDYITEAVSSIRHKIVPKQNNKSLLKVNAPENSLNISSVYNSDKAVNDINDSKIALKQYVPNLKENKNNAEVSKKDGSYKKEFQSQKERKQTNVLSSHKSELVRETNKKNNITKTKEKSILVNKGMNAKSLEIKKIEKDTPKVNNISKSTLIATGVTITPQEKTKFVNRGVSTTPQALEEHTKQTSTLLLNDKKKLISFMANKYSNEEILTENETCLTQGKVDSNNIYNKETIKNGLQELTKTIMPLDKNSNNISDIHEDVNKKFSHKQVEHSIPPLGSSVQKRKSRNSLFNVVGSVPAYLKYNKIFKAKNYDYRSGINEPVIELPSKNYTSQENSKQPHQNYSKSFSYNPGKLSTILSTNQSGTMLSGTPSEKCINEFCYKIKPYDNVTYNCPTEPTYIDKNDILYDAQMDNINSYISPKEFEGIYTNFNNNQVNNLIPIKQPKLKYSKPNSSFTLTKENSIETHNLGIRQVVNTPAKNQPAFESGCDYYDNGNHCFYKEARNTSNIDTKRLELPYSNNSTNLEQENGMCQKGSCNHEFKIPANSQQTSEARFMKRSAENDFENDCNILDSKANNSTKGSTKCFNCSEWSDIENEEYSKGYYNTSARFRKATSMDQSRKHLPNTKDMRFKKIYSKNHLDKVLEYENSKLSSDSSDVPDDDDDDGRDINIKSAFTSLVRKMFITKKKVKKYDKKYHKKSKAVFGQTGQNRKQ